MNLRVFDICREGTHVLGPGLRYVVWVQGCNRCCPGCVTPESRSVDGGVSLRVEDIVADIVLHPNIDGITISGGEPFLQAEAVAELLRQIKGRRPDLTVIIYTGYEFSQLAEVDKSGEVLEYTDVLIDGPYVESLNDNKGIRGSSNQRIIRLSSRLDNYIREMESGDRKIQYVLNQDGMLSKIGVPSKNNLSHEQRF